MILILSADDRASSIFAEILKLHGVWFGKCSEPDMFNKYGGFENSEIKAVMNRFYHAGELKPWRMISEKPGLSGRICDVLERQGYSGGPWAYTAHPAFHRCFDSETPFKIVLRSSERKEAGWEHIIESLPYHVVMKDVMARRYSMVESVLRHCRLDFKKGIADDVISRMPRDK